MENLTTKILDTKFAKNFSQLLSEEKHIPGIVVNLKSNNDSAYQIGISEYIQSHDYVKNINKIRPLNFMVAEFPIIYIGIIPKEYAGDKPEHPEYEKLKDKLNNEKEKFQNFLEGYISKNQFSFGEEEYHPVTTSMKEWKGHGGPCLVNNLSTIPKETLELLPFKIQIIEQFKKSIDAKITDIYYEIII